jgi:hypothetical protein
MYHRIGLNKVTYREAEKKWRGNAVDYFEILFWYLAGTAGEVEAKLHPGCSMFWPGL